MITATINGLSYRMVSMTINGSKISRREMMVDGIKYKCVVTIEFLWIINRNQDVERSYSDVGSWLYNAFYDAATNTIKTPYIPLVSDFYVKSATQWPYYYPVDFASNTITYVRTYSADIINRFVRRLTRTGGIQPLSIRYPVPTSPYAIPQRMYDYNDLTKDFFVTNLTSFFTRIRFANGFVTDHGKWATGNLEHEGFTLAEAQTLYIEAWEFHADEVYHLNLDLSAIRHFAAGEATIEIFGSPQGYATALVPLKLIRRAGEVFKLPIT